MSGGTYNPEVGKVRPGSYININSTRKKGLTAATRGTVLVPLFKSNWGPNKEIVEISGEAPDRKNAVIGGDVLMGSTYNALLVREALKGAYVCKAYIVNNGTAATASASELTVTARYGGTLGNQIKVAIAENPVGGKDVSVFLGTDQVGQYAGVSTVAELISAAEADPYVVFSGSGNLSSNAGISLEGGSDGTVTNSDITGFLDMMEKVKYNSVAFPVDDVIDIESLEALKVAFVEKVRYLHDGMGVYIHASMADHAADSEFVDNVTNSVALSTGESLTHAQASVWVAASGAGSKNTESLTWVEYPDAVAVIDGKSNEEATEALLAGEFFFSVIENEDGREYIGVEQDINSLTSLTQTRTKEYRKNRVMRVYDTFCETVKRNMRPSRYSQDENGYGRAEGDGKLILKKFSDDGAIKNVDMDNDFVVDRGKSQDDELYFNVAILAVDASEKLYFAIGTR